MEIRNLQSAGTIKIAKGLQNTSSLTVFSIFDNNISEEAAGDIATVLDQHINFMLSCDQPADPLIRAIRMKRS